LSVRIPQVRRAGISTRSAPLGGVAAERINAVIKSGIRQAVRADIIILWAAIGGTSADVVTVVEFYRGVSVLRDDAAVRVSDATLDIAQSIVRFHAFPRGVKMSGQSIEAVRDLIDHALDAPETDDGSGR